MNDNNSNGGLEDLFSINPMTFMSSDLRALRIIAEGIAMLNKTVKEGTFEDAVKFLKVQDPVVKMAVLTRFTETWNTLVETFSTLDAYFRLFDASQSGYLHEVLDTLDVAFKRIGRELEPQIEARLEVGFDQPWTPGKLPEVQQTPHLSDAEERVASFLLRQMWSGSNESDIHNTAIDD